MREPFSRSSHPTELTVLNIPNPYVQYQERTALRQPFETIQDGLVHFNFLLSCSITALVFQVRLNILFSAALSSLFLELSRFAKPLMQRKVFEPLPATAAADPLALARFVFEAISLLSSAVPFKFKFN